MLKRLLAHPLTRGLAIDDPDTTALRRQIIRSKPFLKKIYDQWYAMLERSLPHGDGAVLELGSGAGYFDEYVPGLITSDLMPCPNIRLVADGQALPLADASLRAVVMVDVLHHIPQPRRFFAEAARCVRPGGVVAMIEPWVSAWSRVIYRHLHHEPFEPDSAEWEFATSGPLSGANGAMPWIIFERDRKQFEREFPEWRVRSVLPFMPLRYLLSGGVSMRSLQPGWSHGAWRCVEGALSPLRRSLAMFAHVVVERV